MHGILPGGYTDSLSAFEGSGTRVRRVLGVRQTAARAANRRKTTLSTFGWDSMRRCCSRQPNRKTFCRDSKSYVSASHEASTVLEPVTKWVYRVYRGLRIYEKTQDNRLDICFFTI